MAVLNPKIVNAYTKFSQNCVYYKRNFSVLPRKHHYACEKRIGTLSNQLGHTERVRVPCVFRKLGCFLSMTLEEIWYMGFAILAY